MASNSTAAKKVYNCGRCGLPKKGHVCLNPKEEDEEDEEEEEKKEYLLRPGKRKIVDSDDEEDEELQNLHAAMFGSGNMEEETAKPTSRAKRQKTSTSSPAPAPPASAPSMFSDPFMAAAFENTVNAMVAGKMEQELEAAKKRQLAELEEQLRQEMKSSMDKLQSELSKNKRSSQQQKGELDMATKKLKQLEQQSQAEIERLEKELKEKAKLERELEEKAKALAASALAASSSSNSVMAETEEQRRDALWNMQKKFLIILKQAWRSALLDAEACVAATAPAATSTATPTDVYSVIGQNGETHFYTDTQHKIVAECVEKWEFDATLQFPAAFSYTVSGTVHTVKLSMENGNIYQTNESTQVKRQVTLRTKPSVAQPPGAEELSMIMNKMKLPLIDTNGDFVFEELFQEMTSRNYGPDELLTLDKKESYLLNELYESFSRPFCNIVLEKKRDKGQLWFRPHLLFNFLRMAKIRFDNFKKSGCARCASDHCMCSTNFYPCNCRYCEGGATQPVVNKKATYYIWTHGTPSLEAIKKDPLGMNTEMFSNANYKGNGFYNAPNDYVSREWVSRKGGRIVMGVSIDPSDKHFLQDYRMDPMATIRDEPQTWRQTQVHHANVDRNPAHNGVFPFGDVGAPTK